MTLEELEKQLSPIVLHAYQTRRFAFERGSDTLTVGDIGRMIRLLYGDMVADELAAHIRARADAVLPNASGGPMPAASQSISQKP